MGLTTPKRIVLELLWKLRLDFLSDTDPKIIIRVYQWNDVKILENALLVNLPPLTYMHLWRCKTSVKIKKTSSYQEASIHCKCISSPPNGMFLDAHNVKQGWVAYNSNKQALLPFEYHHQTSHEFCNSISQNYGAVNFHIHVCVVSLVLLQLA